MESVHKEYLEEAEQRISGAKSSMLAMAAPLESSGSTSQAKPKPQAAPEPKKNDARSSNQKYGLLNALLSLGAIRPAIAILTQFPWMVDAFPEIADLIIRILLVSISPLYQTLPPSKDRNTSFTQPRTRYGASSPPQRKSVLTLWAPPPPATVNTDFVFFFPDWSDRVPICTTLVDLENVFEPLLRFIHLHISRDTLLLTKFLRAGRHHLDIVNKKSPEVDLETPVAQFWYKVLRLYLLPALPLISGNAICTVEIWTIIRAFEITARWRLYGEWKNATYASHPDLRVRFVQADRESKGILRRLSLNTIDSLSGPVGKLAHSNPCVFFTNAVNQIMAYDNLADVVIQSLRYVTNMGFDVLVFVILDAFANPNKARVKDDGVNSSDWLQSTLFELSSLNCS